MAFNEPRDNQPPRLQKAQAGMLAVDTQMQADGLSPVKVGAVAYLNALPLVTGLQKHLKHRLVLDVPGRLFAHLEAGDIDMALCPVADLMHAKDYALVPCGAIGCCGPTWTVRLYSRIPIDQIDTVWADTHSHSSVALLKVLWTVCFQKPLRVIPFDAMEESLEGITSVLLIGDKVVTDTPPEKVYPHVLDLGQAWHEWTGLPFVFATWICKKDAVLGDLPLLMHETLTTNLQQVDAIAEQEAEPRGWPVDLAKEYMGQVLKYRMTDDALAGLQRFADTGAQAGLWPERSALPVWGQANNAGDASDGDRA